jgi:hypothetical protein
VICFRQYQIQILSPFQSQPMKFVGINPIDLSKRRYRALCPRFSSSTVTTLPLRPNLPTRPDACKYEFASTTPQMNTCERSGRSIPRTVAAVATSNVGFSSTPPLLLLSRSSPNALMPSVRRSYTACCTGADAGRTSNATFGTAVANMVAIPSIKTG